jgi:tetratricopeptide (TPR) repeat protein
MTGTDEARGIELLELARTRHAAGDYREALATARDVIARLGESPSAASLTALSIASATAAACLVQLGDPGGALDVVRRARAISGHAGSVESHLTLDVAEGEILADTGRVEIAIPLLEAAARIARESAPPWCAITLVVLGIAYIAAGRYADAIAAADGAVVLQDRVPALPDRARPHVVIARAAVALGDLARAESAWATALEIAQTGEERGNEAWAAFAGAALALRRGDRAGGEQRLDEAQEIAEELGMMRLVEHCRALLRSARERQMDEERTSDSRRRSES